MNRIRTLDGWRGIAILLVIAEHVTLNDANYHIWANMGSVGVDIFFGLSGYLITARLLEERSKSSTINLLDFYLRRAFRILPVVIAYLSVLGITSRFTKIGFRPSEFAGSLFLFRNYQYAAHPGGFLTGQFWSHSIEEHFYLFWPALFLRAGSKRAIWIAVSGACLCAAWRIYDCAHPNGPIGQFLPGATPGLRTYRTDVRIDGLLLGCALAILLARPGVYEFISRSCPKETPLVCGTLLILNLQRANGLPTITTYLLITAMLASTLVVEEGISYKWLNSRILVGIGTISYSLYVWQQLFLVHPPGVQTFGKLSEFPYNVACAFVVATCSFYFLEKPTARLGRRLTDLRATSRVKIKPSKEILSA